jgi:hypothetical protein
MLNERGMFMRRKIEPLGWQRSLSELGKRNSMRPTRLEVLGPDREVVSDFWLEDGLLLEGITMEMDRDRGPTVEIMLRASAGATSHMTHTVAGVKRLAIDRTSDPDDALEVEDKEGTLTIMRFESESDRVTQGAKELVRCEKLF